MVVATLAVVEDPQPELFVPVETINDDDPSNKSTSRSGPELLFARPKPITSKIRTTIRHLRTRAGRWSPFRGFGIFLIWTLCQAILVPLLSLGYSGRNLIAYAPARIVSDIILAAFELAWVHVVISEPSTKCLCKRIPGARSWAKIAPAVALRSTAHELSLILPLCLAPSTLGFGKDHDSVAMLHPNSRSPVTNLGIFA